VPSKNSQGGRLEVDTQTLKTRTLRRGSPPSCGGVCNDKSAVKRWACQKGETRISGLLVIRYQETGARTFEGEKNRLRDVQRAGAIKEARVGSRSVRRIGHSRAQKRGLVDVFGCVGSAGFVPASKLGSSSKGDCYLCAAFNHSLRQATSLP